MCISRPLYYVYQSIVHTFAIIGLIFVAVFFAIQFRLTDVAGKVDERDAIFSDRAAEQLLTLRNQAVAPSIVGLVAGTQSEMATQSSQTASAAAVVQIDQQISELHRQKQKHISDVCRLHGYAQVAPQNVLKVLQVRKTQPPDIVIGQMLFAIRTRVSDPTMVDVAISDCVQQFATKPVAIENIQTLAEATQGNNIFSWANTAQWQVVQESIKKDEFKIKKAALVANLPPRVMVSTLMVEQLRLYFTQRELYQKYFEPLKILANAYKVSLGVMSIKEETGRQIELHLKDTSSPYYLGKEYETILDYPPGVDQPRERYNRLSSDDHYWNYLYGALYLKQLQVQWQRAGHDISNRPEIIGTLFNVGFSQSEPNASPKVGGSTIVIDGQEYSFGRLAFEFYYSGEMSQEFPLEIK
jgi:hypothetical protein